MGTSYVSGEELVVHNGIDPVCKVYHDDKLLGEVRNNTELLDFQAQVYQKYKGQGKSRVKSGYWVDFDGMRLDIDTLGKIYNCPGGFYDSMDNSLEILFEVYD